MLHEKRVTEGNFLLIKHHSLVLESKEPREGYEPIVVTNPKKKNEDGTPFTLTKYIKRYEAVDGMIKRIEWYDSKDAYATRFMGLKIHLTDKGEYFQIDLPYNSRPYDAFTKLAENIDYAKPVEFSVWHNRRDDNTAFAVRQDEIPIKWKYVKDDMGECPNAVQDELGNWDFKAQRIWLRNQMLTVVIPHVDAINAFDEPEPEYSGTDAENEDDRSERAAIESEAAFNPPSKGKAKAKGADEPPEMPPMDTNAIPPDDNSDIPW